jgi:hypothetical protein
MVCVAPLRPHLGHLPRRYTILVRGGSVTAWIPITSRNGSPDYPGVPGQKPACQFEHLVFKKWQMVFFVQHIHIPKSATEAVPSSQFP